VGSVSSRAVEHSACLDRSWYMLGILGVHKKTPNHLSEQSSHALASPPQGVVDEGLFCFYDLFQDTRELPKMVFLRPLCKGGTVYTPTLPPSLPEELYPRLCASR